MPTLDLGTELETRRLNADKGLVQLAAAAARGDPVDPDDVIDRLAVAGVSPEAFQDRLTINQELVELDRQAAEADPQGKALHAARKALKEHKDRVAAILAKEAPVEQDLVKAIQLRTRNLEAAEDARRRAQVLRVKHRHELGLEIDLDHSTLQYGETVINTSDPAAPTLHVDADTFRDESDRRRQLLAVFEAERQAEFHEAFQTWARDKPRTMGGFPEEPRNDPAPKRPAPATWKECLEAHDAAL